MMDFFDRFKFVDPVVVFDKQEGKSDVMERCDAEKLTGHDYRDRFLIDDSPATMFFYGRIFESLFLGNGNPAAALAKMRHEENYTLVADAIKHWREKIDPTLSASKAANELMRVVPLSHKKLAEVVAAEKKKRQK